MKDITINKTPTYGFARIKHGIIDGLHYPLLNHKIFSGLAIAFTVAASTLNPEQMLGYVGFAMAAMGALNKSGNSMRMMFSMASVPLAAQYAMNIDHAIGGVVLSSIAATRGTILSYLKDDDKNSGSFSIRKKVATTSALLSATGIIAGALYYGDTVTEKAFLALPIVTTLLSSAADFFSEKQAYNARFSRILAHSNTGFYDGLIANNIGGVLANSIVVANVLKTSLKENDFKKIGLIGKKHNNLTLGD